MRPDMGRPYIPYPVPEAQLRAELCTTVDRLVAAKYGVSMTLVGRWRARLGVTVTTGQPRASDRQTLRQRILALLPTMPKGLRQVDLARRFGVSRQAVQQALKGLQAQGNVTVVVVPRDPRRPPYWAYEQRWMAVPRRQQPRTQRTRPAAPAPGSA